LGISAATIVGCIEMMIGSVHACVSNISKRPTMIYLTFFEYTQTQSIDGARCVIFVLFGNIILFICLTQTVFKFKIAIGKIVGRSNQDTEKGVQVSPGPSRAAQDNFHPIFIQTLFSNISS